MKQVIMNNNRKITPLLVAVTLMTATPTRAQKFDPDRFDAERAHFIVQETGLSKEDSTTFFTLYNEMQARKRELHCQSKALPKEMPSTEDSCSAIIIECDKLELQMKAVEQDYHARMLAVLQPSLVFRLLKAETAFYRQAFHRAAKKMND